MLKILGKIGEYIVVVLIFTYTGISALLNLFFVLLLGGIIIGGICYGAFFLWNLIF